MSNLVVRLRRVFGGGLGIEAADRIEEMEREVERLTAERDALLSAVDTATNAIERVGTERDEARRDADELAELLEEAVHQACYVRESNEVDSCAQSAYANALEALEERGVFRSRVALGRRVIGEWVPLAERPARAALEATRE